MRDAAQPPALVCLADGGSVFTRHSRGVGSAYTPSSVIAGLAPEVRDHEPRLALDGGPDGLAFYRRIAAGVGAFLKPGGWLLVEIGATQEDAVRGLLAERPELEVGKTLKDDHGLPRVVGARKR